MEQVLRQLLKMVVLLNKKKMGKMCDMARNKIEVDSINELLRGLHQADGLMLKLQNHLHGCSNRSLFIQRQLELRLCQK